MQRMEQKKVELILMLAQDKSYQQMKKMQKQIIEYKEREEQRMRRELLNKVRGFGRYIELSRFVYVNKRVLVIDEENFNFEILYLVGFEEPEL